MFAAVSLSSAAHVDRRIHMRRSLGSRPPCSFQVRRTPSQASFVWFPFPLCPHWPHEQARAVGTRIVSLPQAVLGPCAKFLARHPRLCLLRSPQLLDSFASSRPNGWPFRALPDHPTDRQRPVRSLVVDPQRTRLCQPRSGVPFHPPFHHGSSGRALRAGPGPELFASTCPARMTGRLRLIHC